MRVAFAMALVLMAGPASAAWRCQLPETVCKGLWPHDYRPAPLAPVIDEVVPAPHQLQQQLDEAPPVVIQPPETVIPRPRPVVAPVVVKPKPRIKSKFVQPKFCSDEGPDLPWACWQVRLGSLGKTRAQLKAEGETRGIKLSCKQIKQAEACLKGVKS